MHLREFHCGGRRIRRTIIKAGLLIDGTDGQPVPDPVIVVENGLIKSITSRAAASGAATSEANDQVIDAAQKTVLPAFIDAHVHLAWGQDDQPEWSRVVEDEGRILLWATRMAQNALVAGFVTVGDCGGPGMVTYHLRDAIEAGLIAGPRLRIAGPPLTTTAGHCWFFGLEANNADELRHSVRRVVAQGSDFIKIMATGGSLSPRSNRRRAQYSVAELRAAVEDAHRLGKRVVVHANATEGIRNAVEAEVDVIAHCNWLGVDEGTLEYDESTAAAMLAAGISVDLNIAAVFLPLAERDGWAQDWGTQTRWDIIRRMQTLGIRVYLSSDAIGLGDVRFVDQLVRMVEQNRATASEIISMITRLPSQAMGLGDETGTVRPGMRADLVLLDANPLEDIRALRSPDSVIRAGKTVVSQGKLLLPDIG